MLRLPNLRITALTATALLLSPVAAFAQEAPPIDKGDTAFMLVAAALVLFMTPGLAFFYGGMVRGKNVLSTLMQSYVMMCTMAVVWALVGYSLAFGPDAFGGLIGDFTYVGLQGVGATPSVSYATTIPHILFVVFQGMFAIITPALITGAFAERIQFRSFLVFAVAWVLLVYAPLAHWVWSVDGWLLKRGAWDFAGGTVVHISSAISALAAVMIIGKRKGFQSEPMIPHNVPLTVLGIGILWFGWFGFNAGSALSANGQAAMAFMATNSAAAAAGLGWMFTDWVRHGKPTVLGSLSGAVAGLVAITPACGFVSPLAAIIIGLSAGVVCNLAVGLRNKVGLDDSLDVLGVHGVGGSLGAVLTGVFATDEFLVHGTETFTRGQQVLAQMEGVLATYVFAFVMSFIILKVIDKTMGLRVSEDAEIEGLDLSQHGERAYTQDFSGAGRLTREEEPASSGGRIIKEAFE